MTQKPLISLLMPTRGRVEMAKRFFQSVRDTATHPDAIEIMLYVDEDDAPSHMLGSFPGLNIRMIVGPRKSMGYYNMTCLQASKGDIIVLANDDIVIRSHAWDERLRAMDASCADKIYLAYPNDLYKGPHLTTFPVLSRKCCEIIGNPYPVEYTAGFIDYHLMDIFKRLEHAGFALRHYLHDVVFEHMHVRAGKAEMDDTYRQASRFGNDDEFLKLVPLRQDAAARLLAYMRSSGTATSAATHTSLSPMSFSKPFVTLRQMTELLLFDTGLPLRWRAWLWIWFMGRYAARRGWLRPFVTP